MVSSHGRLQAAARIPKDQNKSWPPILHQRTTAGTPRRVMLKPEVETKLGPLRVMGGESAGAHLTTTTHHEYRTVSIYATLCAHTTPTSQS